MNGFRIIRKQRTPTTLTLWFDPADPQEIQAPHVLIMDEAPDTHRDFHLAFANDFNNPAHWAGPELASQTSVKPSLSKSRYDLEHALTASEGVDKIKKSVASRYPFQVAFVGIRALGPEGLEELARLWEVDPLLQIVLVTGDSDSSWPDLLGRLCRTDKLLLLKTPFERIEAILIASTLARKWFLGRQAQALTQREQFEPHWLPRASSDSFDGDFGPKSFSNSLSCVHAEEPSRDQREFKQRSSKDALPLPRGLAANQADALFLCRTIEAVEKHMSDCDFDVDALSRVLFISRRQLLRRVKVVAGCAPNVLIRRLRLKRAAELLKHSGFTVSEITYSVGFSDLKHFREVFREQYGVCPGDYAPKAEPRSKMSANWRG